LSCKNFEIIQELVLKPKFCGRFLYFDWDSLPMYQTTWRQAKAKANTSHFFLSQDTFKNHSFTFRTSMNFAPFLLATLKSIEIKNHV
jgi:hypothetical protein